MRMHARVLALGVVAALGVSFLTVSSRAADEDKVLRETIDNLAAAVAKNPAAGRKKAAEVAKTMESLEDMMNLFRKRTKDGKGGFGIGAKPTGMMDDGIEARIQNYAKKGPPAATLAKEAEALEQAALRVAAMAEVTLAKAPAKKIGDKDPKEWKELSDEMSKSALDLAKVFKGKDPKAVKEAASKLNSTCTNCHSKFRD